MRAGPGRRASYDAAVGDRAVVVGGGAIGVACAHYLAEEGFDVTLLDRGEVGRGCSFANAGLNPAQESVDALRARRRGRRTPAPPRAATARSRSGRAPGSRSSRGCTGSGARRRPRDTVAQPRRSSASRGCRWNSTTISRSGGRRRSASDADPSGVPLHPVARGGRGDRRGGRLPRVRRPGSRTRRAARDGAGARRTTSAGWRSRTGAQATATRTCGRSSTAWWPEA